VQTAQQGSTCNALHVCGVCFLFLLLSTPLQSALRVCLTFACFFFLSTIGTASACLITQVLPHDMSKQMICVCTTIYITDVNIFDTLPGRSRGLCCPHTSVLVHISRMQFFLSCARFCGNCCYFRTLKRSVLRAWRERLDATVTLEERLQGVFRKVGSAFRGGTAVEAHKQKQLRVSPQHE